MTKEKSVQLDDVPFKSKKAYPSFFENLKNYFSEYTSSTSLHGFQYLGDQKRSIFEKIFWTFIISACFTICTMMILKTHEKWTNSPVIVSFAQSPTPVGAIPFPAVTICSETKSRQTVFNFTDYYHKNRKGENMTNDEMKMYEDASLLCDSHVHLRGSKKTDFDVVDFFEEIAPEHKDMFMACTWQNMNETCDTLFYKMLSEEGVCFTFNMLNRDAIYTNEVYHKKDFLDHQRSAVGWSLEAGYETLQDDISYPFKAVTAGAVAGLSILLKANEDDLDYICRGPVQGFKVLLHPPDEVPRVSMQFFRLPLDQEVIVAIKPDMMTTSPSLKSYDPHKRGCFFSQERKLRFYNTYSQQNCDIECLTNVTERKCGCVAYHMPHTENAVICGSGSTLCLREAQITTVASTNTSEPTGCDCLPACTAIVYNAETSQADFKWKKVLDAYETTEDFSGKRMARMRLFYKEMQFITSERNELYGITDFMANCGGLLGLFIGFSFVSLIETVYFVTLRLLVNILKFGRHFWSASDELLENDAYLHPYKEESKTK